MELGNITKNNFQKFAWETEQLVTDDKNLSVSVSQIDYICFYVTLSVGA